MPEKPKFDADKEYVTQCDGLWRRLYTVDLQKRLTHTVTQTRKGPKSGGEDVRLILSAALCFSAACSHDLRHEIAHLLGGTFLHLPRDMGVCAERKSCVEVSEHTGHSFDVHAILQSQGCECVPLRYNYDKPEKPRISRAFGYLARFFILFQTEKSSREVVIS